MSEFSSVLELAREVAGEANRIKSGLDAELNAERVVNRVNETRADLGTLGQAVKAVERLAEAARGTAVDLARLDDGRANFERLARESSQPYLPSDRAFNDARKKIRDVTARIIRDFKDAWGEWVCQEIDGVPSIKIPQLDLADQEEAQARWEQLVKVSRTPNPKSDDINTFKSHLEYLHEVLDGLPNLPDPVRELYDRLARRPALTLADLTNEQIAELRQANVDAQIEVRRRGA